MKYLLVWVISFLFIYLSVSFICWDLNLSSISKGDRFFMVFMFVFVGGVLSAIIRDSVIKKKKDENTRD